MDSKTVWYACYGSNMSKQRFMCYIVGGTPKYANAENYGCDLKEDRELLHQKEVVTFTANHRLYFKKNSARWRDAKTRDGGVAFLGLNEDDRLPTLCRLYLLSKSQFRHVREEEGPKWYSEELNLGNYEDGIPIVTLTSGADFNIDEITKPSKNYLKTMIEGLKETYPGMGADAISKYLFARINDGKNRYTTEEIEKLVE